MKYKLIALIFILILITGLLIGCKEKDDYYSSIVIGQQKNIIYVHNLSGTRNDDKNWTQINLSKDTTQDFANDAVKIEFKTGDLITFKGKGYGGWHDISEINIVSHDNPIPNSK